MNPVPPFRIEKATPADIPLVLSLIRELAEFEHLLQEARATDADLRETRTHSAPGTTFRDRVIHPPQFATMLRRPDMAGAGLRLHCGLQ